MVEGGFYDPADPDTFVAFNGTMPILVREMGHATWLALCSTDTHVSLVYFGMTMIHAGDPPLFGGYDAFDLTVEASAYDMLASGLPDSSDPELPLMRHVKGEYLQIGRGSSTRDGAISGALVSGGDFALATGRR
jgi:hypothetical protein